MTFSNAQHAALIDVEQSVLIVIDVQPYFLDRYAEAARTALLNRIVWLMAVAQALDVPLIITGEDIENVGTVAKPILEAAAEGTPVWNKMVYGLADQPDILAAVAATGRSTPILVGLETDVCVAQSALGLTQRGYRTVVVADAVNAPQQAHQFGLQRMRDAGVLVSSTKGLYYEWVRTVARTHSFWRENGVKVGRPAGLLL